MIEIKISLATQAFWSSAICLSLSWSGCLPRERLAGAGFPEATCGGLAGSVVFFPLRTGVATGLDAGGGGVERPSLALALALFFGTATSSGALKTGCVVKCEHSSTMVSDHLMQRRPIFFGGNPRQCHQDSGWVAAVAWVSEIELNHRTQCHKSWGMNPNILWTNICYMQICYAKKPHRLWGSEVLSHIPATHDGPKNPSYIAWCIPLTTCRYSEEKSIYE